MTSTLRPLLAPGTRLFRLSRTTAVIGSNPGTPIKLRPGVFELLRLLDGVRTLETLQQLAEHRIPEFEGHVRDVLLPLVQTGALMPHRPATFTVVRPTIDFDGPARDFASRLEASLPYARAAVGEHTWHIIISTGEPAREVFEAFIAARIPHLPLVLDQDTVHLGPLVLPTQSPCLLCYDSARNQTQAGWLAMSAQFGTAVVESGVALSTQYQAIATLLERLENDGGDSLIARRVSVSPEQEIRTREFGFAGDCHCHLMSA